MINKAKVMDQTEVTKLSSVIPVILHRIFSLDFVQLLILV